MNCSSMPYTFLFILLALLIGQGDGRGKKSNREMLQHDIKLFKKMTEKIKYELGAYYEDFYDEPFADYFIEEIDYLQSKLDRNMKRKARTDKQKEINYSLIDQPNIDSHKLHYIEDTLQGVKASGKNVTLMSTDRNIKWPSFEHILTEMGKKYDWKNDRWIKVKNKIKDKDKQLTASSKNNIEHIKHNFRYKIVKLNRAKSKRNIVVTVTAVR